MKCCIVKDLLPGYIDGLTSAETDEEIRKHLAECDACRTAYEQMTAEIPEEILPEKKEIDFLKKWKARIWHRYAAVAIFTFGIVFLLMSGIGFARNLPNFMDGTTLGFVLFPCALLLFCTRSGMDFIRSFALAFQKKEAPLESYKESLRAAVMVMGTAGIFGGIGFLVGMINCIRSTDFSEPYAFVWLVQGTAVAMLSLFYPLLICVILLPVCSLLKKRMNCRNREAKK